MNDIFHYIDIEIYEITELLEALTGGIILGEEQNLEGDMKVINDRLESLIDAKNMINKAGHEMGDFDKILLMNVKERKWFFRFLKFVSWFRFKK